MNAVIMELRAAGKLFKIPDDEKEKAIKLIGMLSDTLAGSDNRDIPTSRNFIEDPRGYLEMVCSRVYDVPHYGRREYSERTLLTWISAYRQGGLDRLLPPDRKDKGISRTIPPSLGERLIELRQEYTGLSVQLFYDQMLKEGFVI